MHRRSLLASAAAIAAMAFPAASWADEFPSRPIRIIVPVGPGFGTDTIARLLVDKLRVKLGQAVIVENRAGGHIGAEAAARAAPDGYTLFLSAPGPLSINKALYPKLAYDPADFVPISLVASIPNALLVPASSQFKSVVDVIAYAKENPGKLNYASGGAGTTPHLAAELLKSQANLEIVHVPYKGGAAATTGLLQGQTDLVFAEISSTFTHIKSGRLRAIAVGTPARVSFMPDVPTMSETLPGFVTTTWYGLVAPPKTPAAIASKISSAVIEIVKQPDTVAKLQGMNIQPIASTAPDLARYVHQETDRWGKVIRAAKIDLD